MIGSCRLCQERSWRGRHQHHGQLVVRCHVFDTPGHYMTPTPSSSDVCDNSQRFWAICCSPWERVGILLPSSTGDVISGWLPSRRWPLRHGTQSPAIVHCSVHSFLHSATRLFPNGHWGTELGAVVTTPGLACLEPCRGHHQGLYLAILWERE